MTLGYGGPVDFGRILFGDLAKRGITAKQVSSRTAKQISDQCGVSMRLPLCVADAVELWNHSIEQDMRYGGVYLYHRRTTTTNFGEMTKDQYLDDIVTAAYEHDIENEKNANAQLHLRKQLRQHRERARKKAEQEQAIAEWQLKHATTTP